MQPTFYQSSSWVFHIAFLLAGCVANSPAIAQRSTPSDQSPWTTTEVNAPESSNNPKVIVIRDVTLVDGRGGKPVERAVVVVQDSKIIAVGTVGQVDVPADAEVIDGSGKTMLPGLLDPHLHVGRDSKTMLQRPFLILSRGVTSARDPGRAIEDYAPLLASGKRLPRLFLTGKHFDQQPHAHPYNALDIQTPRQARDAVDEIVRKGGSAIKVYYRLPLPLINATCDQADKHGIPVTAHLELFNAEQAIASGIDGLEHVTSCGTSIAAPEDAELFRKTVDADNAARRPWRFRLWAKIDLEHPRVKKFINLLADQGIFLTPTLNVFERRSDDQFDSEPYHVDGFQTMLRFIQLCHEAGVPIVASSHGKPPVCEEGWAMQHEMRLLHEAGLSELEVITASTRTPAQFFGCADRLGTIQVGKQADLVLYDGQPHQDLDDLWKVSAVMQAGRWVRKPQQPKRTGRFSLEKNDQAWTVLDRAGDPIFLVGINHLRDTVPPGSERTKFYRRAVKNIRSWGVNHLGYGTPEELHSVMPFMQEQIYTYGSQFRERPRFSYVDVFDPTFQRETREKVRAVCESVKDHTNLIGHYWTDTTRWDIDTARRLRGKDWVSAIRELPADAPGKRRYAEFLQRRYNNNPAAYTQAYGHLIADFDDIRLFDFREFDRQSKAGRADDEAFLGLIATELYGVIGQAYRDFAPHTLIFGPRFKLHDHPDVVLNAVKPWIDVISIQPGPEVGPRPGPGRDESVFDGVVFDRIHEITGKPILICDHRVSFYTPETPVTLWHQFETQQKAVDVARTFMLSAAAKPYLIGYSHCQYLDKRSPERGNMVKPGFLRVNEQPYKVYVRGITTATKEMKATHAKKFE